MWVKNMKKILEELESGNRIAISGHIRPDGDCVGSCVGLYLYLKKALPDARVDVYLEEPAPVFSCMEGVAEIKKIGRASCRERV